MSDIVRIYTIGPHSSAGLLRGTLNWTRDRFRARTVWEEFWRERAVPFESAATSGERYAEVYSSLQKPERASQRGPGENAAPSPPIELGSGMLASLNTLNIRRQGFVDSLMGVSTSRFDGFEPDGVAYKDVPIDQVDVYIPPPPEVRSF